MKPAIHRQTLWSLAQAASEAPTLAALQDRIRASNACLQIVKPLLPPNLRAGVQAGPLQDDEWCLLVASAAVSTKLRQLLPAMIQALNQKGYQIATIRLKVRHPERR
jgi:hypothetical protein